jgi:hypothetical protein
VGLALLAACALVSGCHRGAGGGTAAPPAEVEGGRRPPAEWLDTLHARCVEDMVRQVCTVMRDAPVGAPSGVPPGAPASAPEGVVFVAGLGAVEAGLYAELRAAGSGMCDQVRARCAADWSAPACRAARALYPGL